MFMLDFDLEAPGLDSFDFCEDQRRGPGLVDFIEDYEGNLVAPDLSGFISECRIWENQSEKLFLMHSGMGSDDYPVRLNSINWVDLYRKRSGFLLFEDLKEQVKSLGVDYFLIDSRTGHSDVEGICTRQLPDSVVFLFYPNLQNVCGIKEVARRVRNSRGSGEEKIQEHYVVSNVPVVDDEEGILERRLDVLRSGLDLNEDFTFLYRVDSLAFLDQTVFVKDRPNSNLSKSYSSLADKIVSRNLGDDAAAEMFLGSVVQAFPFDGGDSLENIQKVDQILQSPSRSREIRYLASIIKERYGDTEEALSLLDSLIETDQADSRVHLRRARILMQKGEISQAVFDIKKALSEGDLKFIEVSQAVALIVKYAADSLCDALSLAAIRSLKPKEMVNLVSSHLQDTDEAIIVSEKLINDYLREVPVEAEADRQEILHLLSLLLIALGRFTDALRVLDELGVPENPIRLAATAFNRSMAVWGLSGLPDLEYLRIFLDQMKRTDIRRMNANIKQCTSLAYFFMGDFETATLFAREARENAASSSVSIFSAWTYKQQSPKAFVRQISEMEAYFQEGAPLPMFLSTKDLFN